MVNWEAAKRAICGMKSLQQRWVSKAAAHFLPSGKNMKRWKLRTQDHCPQCKHIPENQDHILQCPAPLAIKQWTHSLEKLKTWMKENNNFPTIMQAILHNWHEGKETNSQDMEGTAIDYKNRIALDGI